MRWEATDEPWDFVAVLGEGDRREFEARDDRPVAGQVALVVDPERGDDHLVVVDEQRHGDADPHVTETRSPSIA